MIADRTDTGESDIFIPDPGACQLTPADLPEVEMRGLRLVGMKFCREFIAKVYEFGAARAKRRAYRSQKIFRPDIKSAVDFGNCFVDDICNTPAPAGMDDPCN